MSRSFLIAKEERMAKASETGWEGEDPRWQSWVFIGDGRRAGPSTQPLAGSPWWQSWEYCQEMIMDILPGM